VADACSSVTAWPPPPPSPPRGCGAAAASIAFLTQRTQRGNGEDAETDSNGRRAGRPERGASVGALTPRRARPSSEREKIRAPFEARASVPARRAHPRARKLIAH